MKSFFDALYLGIVLIIVSVGIGAIAAQLIIFIAQGITNLEASNEWGGVIIWLITTFLIVVFYLTKELNKKFVGNDKDVS